MSSGVSRNVERLLQPASAVAHNAMGTMDTENHRNLLGRKRKKPAAGNSASASRKETGLPMKISFHLATLSSTKVDYPLLFGGNVLT